MSCNYNVSTFLKCNYKIITILVCSYNVITLSVPALALSFDTELTDGTLVYGKLEPNEDVFVKNSYLNVGKNDDSLFKIPKDKTGRFVIGIPQDAKELKLEIKTPTHSKEKTFSVNPRAWEEEVVTGLPPAKVNPNADNKKRISAEAEEMRFARQKSVFSHFPNTWSHPVPEFKRISSHFGSRRVLNNIKKQGHSGTDYAAPIGTPVLSPAAGRVVYINPDVFLTGKTVLVDHGFGVFSSYSHLNKISVKLNQELKTGDPIGEIGQTGRATGPHLHFTVTWYGVRINPEDLF